MFRHAVVMTIFLCVLLSSTGSTQETAEYSEEAIREYYEVAGKAFRASPIYDSIAVLDMKLQELMDYRQTLSATSGANVLTDMRRVEDILLWGAHAKTCLYAILGFLKIDETAYGDNKCCKCIDVYFSSVFIAVYHYNMALTTVKGIRNNVPLIENQACLLLSREIATLVESTLGLEDMAVVELGSEALK